MVDKNGSDAKGTLFEIEGLSWDGWTPPEGDVDLDELNEKVLKPLRRAEKAFTWGLADAIVFFEDFGDEAYQYLETDDYDLGTRRRMARMAREIPKGDARRRLSIWKNEIILGQPREIQHEFYPESAGGSVPDSTYEPPTVRAIRNRGDEYEGKSKAETLPEKHCIECGAPAHAWQNEHTTVRAREDESEAARHVVTPLRAVE